MITLAMAATTRDTVFRPRLRRYARSHPWQCAAIDHGISRLRTQAVTGSSPCSFRLRTRMDASASLTNLRDADNWLGRGGLERSSARNRRGRRCTNVTIAEADFRPQAHQVRQRDVVSNARTYAKTREIAGASLRIREADETTDRQLGDHEEVRRGGNLDARCVARRRMSNHERCVARDRYLPLSPNWREGTCWSVAVGVTSALPPKRQHLSTSIRSDAEPCPEANPRQRFGALRASQLASPSAPEVAEVGPFCRQQLRDRLAISSPVHS